MGANDVHGALMLVGFVTSGCYKATVNEPETITDAKTVLLKVLGFALSAVERS
jgi:hypothetical protein